MGRNTLESICSSNEINADIRRGLIHILYENGVVGHNWWSDKELFSAVNKLLDKTS